MYGKDELTPEQVEVFRILCKMDTDARIGGYTDARTKFLAMAILLARSGLLDALCAAVLVQAKDLQIPARPTLFKDIAYDIEHALEDKQNSK